MYEPGESLSPYRHTISVPLCAQNAPLDPSAPFPHHLAFCSAGLHDAMITKHVRVVHERGL